MALVSRNEYSQLVAFVFIVLLEFYYFALLFQAISPLAGSAYQISHGMFKRQS